MVKNKYSYFAGFTYWLFLECNSFDKRETTAFYSCSRSRGRLRSRYNPCMTSLYPPRRVSYLHKKKNLSAHPYVRIIGGYIQEVLHHFMGSFN